MDERTVYEAGTTVADPVALSMHVHNHFSDTVAVSECGRCLPILREEMGMMTADVTRHRSELQEIYSVPVRQHAHRY